MDANDFRLLLVVFGVGAGVGFYLCYQYQRRRRDAERRSRRDPTGAGLDATIGLEPNGGAAGTELAGELTNLGEALTANRDLRGAAAATPPPEEPGPEPARPAVTTIEDPGPGASAELKAAPRSVTQPVIMLSVVATDPEGFSGQAVHGTLRSLGLFYSDIQIFHRQQDDFSAGEVLFSVASMVEPGVIPPQHDETFTTPGLTFFLQLTDTEHAVDRFNNMLFSAERAAHSLGGRLEDARHSTLTRQTIGHLREQILEYVRQRQVERRRW